MHEIMTFAEMANLLRVSKGQLRRLIKTRNMPHIQVTPRGAITFDVNEALAWWKKHSKGGA